MAGANDGAYLPVPHRQPAVIATCRAGTSVPPSGAPVWIPSRTPRLPSPALAGIGHSVPSNGGFRHARKVVTGFGVETRRSGAAREARIAMPLCWLPTHSLGTHACSRRRRPARQAARLRSTRAPFTPRFGALGFGKGAAVPRSTLTSSPLISTRIATMTQLEALRERCARLAAGCPQALVELCSAGLRIRRCGQLPAGCWSIGQTGTSEWVEIHPRTA